MALFQPSVLNKYLKQQGSDVVAKAYKRFVKYFHNPTIQKNIRERKEEQFQEGFLIKLFVEVFDYTLAPNANYNITTELKNEKGAKKADGAILKDGNALGVIELKSTKTKDLEKVRQQAFDYKANQTGCVYVITSNFEKVRFYINNAVEFEDFDLFTINQQRFELLYLCLAKENVLSNVPLKIKEASLQEEEKITKKFYADYSLFKRELFRDLVKGNMKNEVFRAELNNEDTQRANKNIKRHLFKKSQKLIDRFLFIFFAEDRGLLPPNSTLKILEQWKKLKELDEVVPLYNRYKKYFSYLDLGRKGTDKTAEIFAYNGGLFKPEAVLDSLLISDNLLFKHTKDLSHYDFESQVDVNILGHIFENSLNEIESINAEIEETDFDKQKTKRKKDGVFYTPKYITKYIVDNTVGKLCNEKKTKLTIVEEEYLKSRKGRTKTKLKALLASLETYREWLLQITILDPACGSGAFLNQALDFLIKEHQYIDELQTSLLGGGLVFPNIENTVLENNIFGVDLNEESVEIAKLSLWLRTAQPRRKLNMLSNNIKCGNSLIDSKAVAGDKAFKWEEEFTHIFKEKEKKAFHITTATHDSRTSQRMIDYKVRELRENGTRPKAEGIWLEPKDELLITQTVAEIIKKDNLNVMAFNICGDHIHLLLVCEEEELSKIVGKIKGVTSRIYNSNKGISSLVKKEIEYPIIITRGHVPLSQKEGKKPYNSLWTQKFGTKEIKDEKQLWNTVEYIQNNRLKHELPNNKGINPLVEKRGKTSYNKGINSLVKIINEMCCTYEHAFRMEKKGGFDVVIGNPPYVNIANIQSDTERSFLQNNFKTVKNKSDLYTIFVEKGKNLLKDKNSMLSYIMPNSWLGTDSFSRFREMLINETKITELVKLPPGVFKDAIVTTLIISFTKENVKSNNICLKEYAFEEFSNMGHILSYDTIKKINSLTFSFEKNIELNSTKKLGDLADFSLGIKSSNDKRFISFDEFEKDSYPILRGRNISKYYYEKPLENIWYRPDLMMEKKGAGPRNKELFVGDKILIQDVSKDISASFCNENIMVNDTINFIYNVKKQVSFKFILALLNSKLINFWFSRTYSEGLHIKINQLKNIPINIADNLKLQVFDNLVNEILNNTKDFNNSKNKFSKYLQSQFTIEKLPKKLENWHELAFGEFIKELNKIIKKEAKTRGHVPLTKLQEMEWMEVFEARKSEVQTLKAEIDKTDQQIDQMVYELYGLNKEEIAIVESN